MGEYPAYQLTPRLTTPALLESLEMKWLLFLELFFWDLDLGQGLDLHASQVFLEVWLRRNGWGDGVQLLSRKNSL